ncbi:MAG: hypothetical protein AB2A00_32155, partial [Myxococcota bacterium]
MRSVLFATLLAVALAHSAPAHAQSEAPPPATPSAQGIPPEPVPAAPDGKASKPKEDTVTKIKDYFLKGPKDQPTRLERLLVAAGASVLAAVGFGVGIGFGIWAWMDFQCLRDVPTCNKSRPADQQITGTGFLAARAEGERKALFADMGYLLGVTFLGVAVMAVAATFWPAGWWPFYAEEPPMPTPPTSLVADSSAPPPAPAPTPAPEAAPAPEATPAAPEAPAPAPEA